MAVATCLLGDLATVPLDLNIVLVAASREEKRMPEAVGCFYRVLGHEIRRRVTAIARRNRAVRRLYPAVKLLAHDVTVRAGGGIVGQVRPAFGIGKSVDTDAERDADNHAEHDAVDSSQLHVHGCVPSWIVNSVLAENQP